MTLTVIWLVVDGEKNVAGVSTTQQQEVCWFFRRKCIGQDHSRGIPNGIEEVFSQVQDRMRHGRWQTRRRT